MELEAENATLKRRIVELKKQIIGLETAQAGLPTMHQAITVLANVTRHIQRLDEMRADNTHVIQFIENISANLEARNDGML